jgi:hypothetical protein
MMQVPRDVAMVIISIIIKSKKELITPTGMAITRAQDTTGMPEGIMVIMHRTDLTVIITDLTVIVATMHIMPPLRDHM